MNAREYVEMENGHAIDEESWEALWRKLAFVEFDSQLETFVENGYEREWGNGGRSLVDLSPADVERVMDEFAMRFDAYVQPAIDDCMRNAILAATGIYC